MKTNRYWSLLTEIISKQNYATLELYEAVEQFQPEQQIRNFQETHNNNRSQNQIRTARKETYLQKQEGLQQTIIKPQFTPMHQRKSADHRQQQLTNMAQKDEASHLWGKQSTNSIYKNQEAVYPPLPQTLIHKEKIQDNYIDKQSQNKNNKSLNAKDKSIFKRESRNSIKTQIIQQINLKKRDKSSFIVRDQKSWVDQKNRKLKTEIFNDQNYSQIVNSNGAQIINPQQVVRPRLRKLRKEKKKPDQEGIKNIFEVEKEIKINLRGAYEKKFRLQQKLKKLNKEIKIIQIQQRRSRMLTEENQTQNYLNNFDFISRRKNLNYEQQLEKSRKAIEFIQKVSKQSLRRRIEHQNRVNKMIYQNLKSHACINCSRNKCHHEVLQGESRAFITEKFS